MKPGPIIYTLQSHVHDEKELLIDSVHHKSCGSDGQHVHNMIRVQTEDWYPPR